MSSAFNPQEADEQFLDALLENEFSRQQQVARVGAAVDQALSRIKNEQNQISSQSSFQVSKAFRFVAALAASLVVIVGISWLIAAGPRTAHAVVLKTIENTLSAGPRKYDVEITYHGPLRGKFVRQGACYLDGPNQFAFRIPCPLGFDNSWHFGSNGENFWVMMPGTRWQGDGQRLQDWWEKRGFDDAPILHVEAVLDTLSQSYDLEELSPVNGDQRIVGVANEATPGNWADKIELIIDHETGFAGRLVLDWESGRLRHVVMDWDRSAVVPATVFEFGNMDR